MSIFFFIFLNPVNCSEFTVGIPLDRNCTYPSDRSYCLTIAAWNSGSFSSSVNTPCVLFSIREALLRAGVSGPFKRAIHEMFPYSVAALVIRPWDFGGTSHQAKYRFSFLGAVSNPKIIDIHISRCFWQILSVVACKAGYSIVISVVQKYSLLITTKTCEGSCWNEFFHKMNFAFCHSSQRW